MHVTLIKNSPKRGGSISIDTTMIALEENGLKMLVMHMPILHVISLIMVSCRDVVMILLSQLWLLVWCLWRGACLGFTLLASVA